ncbi:hypothetical protein EGW08_016011 [Elysia chlorotica]|uniref:Single domain-containing protein n=1 Tax=Elysia chlorotica TaxID=188477 RepID=A0A3S0ZD88_ELYCH|nr:hypothetical protein EGW08_016011 [Elysia chlorotica]
MRSHSSSRHRRGTARAGATAADCLRSFGGFSVLCGAAALVTMMVVMSSAPSAQVRAAPLLFVEEPMIVSKELITGACVDNTGVERADLAEWTSSAGACDKVVCHVEPSGNYTVTHDCRPREPYENPDSVNCEWISNSSATYPDCCPELSCSTATPLSTIDPLLCYDLASTFACGFWYNITGGCNDTSAFMYNVSQVYCRDTCG